MNNTKIEWCNSTWNPITGCLHKCEYCYARKQAKRFGGCNEKWDRILTPYYNVPLTELEEPLTITRANGQTVKAPYPFGFDPTFHKYRLSEPVKWQTPRTIFVGSMTDLFGDWVPDRWITDVFDACEKAPQHRYLFLTKNPKRYYKLAEQGDTPNGKLSVASNMWFGTTITSVKDPIFWGDAWNTFLSVEPLLTDFKELTTALSKTSIKWVIIGAETGNRKDKVIPQKEWVSNIVENCNSSGIPVFMKNSLIPIIGEENMRRDFPWKV